MRALGFLRSKWPALAITALVAGVAVAGTLVDQGAPGNQGPWYVTNSSVFPSTDGGSAISTAVTTTPALCTVNRHTSIAVSGTALIVPTLQMLRRYLVICNSPQNAGVPLVKCRVDGVAPVMAAGNAGDVLNVGDCVTYPIAQNIQPQCIADTASTNVLTYECR